MKKNLGLPYMGSKSKIAEKILSEIIKAKPEAEIFIDLFAGGCAISHSAILSGSFKKVIANDINAMPKLFKDAILGKYRNEKRWISRDEFHKLKDTDMYVKSCWSFGNNGDNYLYSEHLEPYKKAYHYAKVFGDFSLFNQFAPYIGKELKDNNWRKCIKANYERIKKDYSNWFLSQLKYNPDEVEALLNATQADYNAEAERIRQYLRNALNQSGKTQADINKYLGNQMANHYFGKSQWQLPTKEAYEKLQEILPLEKPYTEISKIIIGIKYKLQNLERLQSLENLQSLQSLERLQRLQNLERLENLSNILEISQGSYKDFKLPKADECVIYCDIPYKGTQTYKHDGEKVEFDYEAFYNWVREKSKDGYKIYISEYQMPSVFKEILVIDTKSLLSAKRQKAVKERLFIYEN